MSRLIVVQVGGRLPRQSDTDSDRVDGVFVLAGRDLDAAGGEFGDQLRDGEVAVGPPVGGEGAQRADDLPGRHRVVVQDVVEVFEQVTAGFDGQDRSPAGERGGGVEQVHGAVDDLGGGVVAGVVNDLAEDRAHDLVQLFGPADGDHGA